MAAKRAVVLAETLARPAALGRAPQAGPAAAAGPPQPHGPERQLAGGVDSQARPPPAVGANIVDDWEYLVAEPISDAELTAAKDAMIVAAAAERYGGGGPPAAAAGDLLPDPAAAAVASVEEIIHCADAQMVGPRAVAPDLLRALEALPLDAILRDPDVQRSVTAALSRGLQEKHGRAPQAAAAALPAEPWDADGGDATPGLGEVLKVARELAVDSLRALGERVRQYLLRLLEAGDPAKLEAGGARDSALGAAVTIAAAILSFVFLRRGIRAVRKLPPFAF